MAQTVTRVTRAVTTDLTVAATVVTARNGMAAIMAALDNLSERDLKALTIIGIANHLNTTLSGTNYTASYPALDAQAATLFGTLDPAAYRNKMLLECALALNAYMYATSVTTLNVNTLIATATTGKLTTLSVPQLDRMLALLRFKSGN
jgi:hypothetical protein